MRPRAPDARTPTVFIMTQRPPSFASAASPTHDNAIHTDSSGLLAGEIAVPTPTGTMPAYRAAPAMRGPHPIVIVVPEIFGLHEHIRDVARRLAKIGYFAVAPDVFFRHGDPSRQASIDDIRTHIISKMRDEQVLIDLDASLEWARQHGGDASRLLATGFCWGGRITWLYAAHQPRLRAAVAWYGRLTGPKGAHQPRHPLDIAGSLRAPVLGLYGGQDESIPLEQVEQMRSALREARSASQVLVYPDAGHAVYADYRPSYRREAAEDGWQRMQAWFHQHLRN
jgi:carboxymethylenebutenolidase